LNVLYFKVYNAKAGQGLVSDDGLPDPERPNWTAILVLAFAAFPGRVGIVTHGRYSCPGSDPGDQDHHHPAAVADTAATAWWLAGWTDGCRSRGSGRVSSCCHRVRDRGQGGHAFSFPTTRRGSPTPAPGLGIPRVIPIEPLPGLLQAQPPAAARPKVIQLRRDSTGLVPGRPPGPPPRRSNDEVAKDVSNLIEMIQEPEAEIALVAGECKVVQTKRTLTRLVVAN